MACLQQSVICRTCRVRVYDMLAAGMPRADQYFNYAASGFRDFAHRCRFARNVARHPALPAGPRCGEQLTCPSAHASTSSTAWLATASGEDVSRDDAGFTQRRRDARRAWQRHIEHVGTDAAAWEWRTGGVTARRRVVVWRPSHGAYRPRCTSRRSSECAYATTATPDPPVRRDAVQPPGPKVSPVARCCSRHWLTAADPFDGTFDSDDARVMRRARMERALRRTPGAGEIGHQLRRCHSPGRRHLCRQRRDSHPQPRHTLLPCGAGSTYRVDGAAHERPIGDLVDRTSCHRWRD